MQTLYAGSFAKYADVPGDNEDVFVVAGNGSCIVVCDGASDSFDARNWAELLAGHFSTHPATQADVAACVAAYVASTDFAALSWSRQMAFERGSFSTLVRVETGALGELCVTTVGDSLVVLTDGETLLHCQPYDTSARFLERPMLLSTVAHHNAAFDDECLAALTQTVIYPPDRPTFLLCMTDAVGAWLLSRTEAGDRSALEDLLAIRSDDELSSLVERERASGLMRRDDATLVISVP
jgi:hypothetical protein